MPSGKKFWRYDYRFLGKRKTFSLGEFPLISLKEATEKHIAISKQLANGLDPNEEKKRAKNEAIPERENQERTFELVAREWLEKVSVHRTQNYAKSLR